MAHVPLPHAQSGRGTGSRRCVVVSDASTNVARRWLRVKRHVGRWAITRFFTVSSKFNNVCATTVIAANSAASRFSSRWSSPIAKKCSASSGSFASPARASEQSLQDPQFGLLGSAAGQQPKHPRQPGNVVRLGPHHPLGQCTSRFDVLGVVQQTRACKGVDVVCRLTAQTSRFAASRVNIAGGGDVRFQYVYRLRRWLPSFVRRAGIRRRISPPIIPPVDTVSRAARRIFSTNNPGW